MTFQTDTTDAGLSLALGTAETHAVDLATAYGTLANGGGRDRPHRRSSRSRTATARTSSRRTCRRRPSRSSAHRRPTSSPTSCARTPSARSTRTGASSRSGTPTARTARRRSRPARTTTPRTSTPTATSRRRPRQDRANGEYALVVGVWNGNSDNTPVSTPAHPVVSLDVPDVRLAGLPHGGHRRLADRPLRAAGRPGQGGHRPVDRRQGPVAATSRSTEWFLKARSPRALSPRTPAASIVLRDTSVSFETQQELDAPPTRTGSAAPSAVPASGAARTGRRRPTSTTSSSSRTARSWGVIVGGCLRPAEPDPIVFRRARPRTRAA